MSNNKAVDLTSDMIESALSLSVSVCGDERRGVALAALMQTAYGVSTVGTDYPDRDIPEYMLDFIKQLIKAGPADFIVLFSGLQAVFERTLIEIDQEEKETTPAATI